MEKEFIALIEEVEMMKAKLTERDTLQEQRQELGRQAREFRDKVIEKYNAEEARIDALAAKAEEENRMQKEEITLLIKKQVKEGSAFKEGERLEKLKASVYSFELNMEAIRQLKKEVVISEEEQRQAEEYIAESRKIIAELRRCSGEITDSLAKISHGSGMTCPAFFDMHVLNMQANGMQEFFAVFNTMRKEGAEE